MRDYLPFQMLWATLHPLLASIIKTGSVWMTEKLPGDGREKRNNWTSDAHGRGSVGT